MENLAEVLMQHQAFDKAKDGIYLSVYLVERAYGGPEEGGWWFDCLTYEGSVFCASEKAEEAFMQSLEKIARQKTKEELEPCRQRHYDMLGDDETVASSCPEGYIPSGWSDGGEYRIIREKTPGMFDTRNQPKPRYE